MAAVLVLLLLAVAQQLGVPPRDGPRATGSAVISGRVSERGSDRPLPRIVVTLTKQNSSTPLETLTDEDGRYQFTDVEPGVYALSAGVDRHRSRNSRACTPPL
jgi:Carboxypeptidase regulatory-like domain